MCTCGLLHIYTCYTYIIHIELAKPSYISVVVMNRYIFLNSILCTCVHVHKCTCTQLERSNNHANPQYYSFSHNSFSTFKYNFATYNWNISSRGWAFNSNLNWHLLLMLYSSWYPSTIHCYLWNYRGYLLNFLCLSNLMYLPPVGSI